MINVMLIFLSALIFTLAIFAASWVDAQEQENVLDCLGDVTNPILYGNGVHPCGAFRIEEDQ